MTCPIPHCDNFSQLVTLVAPAAGERAEQVFAAAGDYFLVPYGSAFDGYDCGVGDFAYAQTHHLTPMQFVRSASEAGDDVEVEPCETRHQRWLQRHLALPVRKHLCRCDFSRVLPTAVWSTPPIQTVSLTRDTDWMLYDHPGGSIIYTSIADFPFQGLVVNNVDDCIDAGVIYATDVNAAGCIAQTDVSGFIPAGTTPSGPVWLFERIRWFPALSSSVVPATTASPSPPTPR